MDWVVTFAVCFTIFYYIGMHIFDKKKLIKDAKKAAFVKEILYLIGAIFLLCMHCYWQVQTWVIVLFVLCVLDAIYKIWCLISFYREKEKENDTK